MHFSFHNCTSVIINPKEIAFPRSQAAIWMAAELCRRLPGFPYDFIKFEQIFSFSLSIRGQYLGRDSSIFLSSGRQMGIKRVLGLL